MEREKNYQSDSENISYLILFINEMVDWKKPMLGKEIMYSEPNSVGKGVLYHEVVVIQRHPFSRLKKVYF